MDLERPDPDLFSCDNCILSGLVTQAFDIRGYQLSAPGWMLSARFNISAKIPPGTTKEQFRLMLQNVLVERFKMTFHRDKKQIQAYELVVAKNGPKLKPSVEAPVLDVDAPPQPSPAKKDANGFPVLSGGNGFRSGIAAERAGLHGDGTVPEFAQELSTHVSPHVVDATGLDGRYDISLFWIPGDDLDNPGPTLTQALQEQLGLKLELKKGIVDIVVVDHMEKTPTEN